MLNVLCFVKAKLSNSNSQWLWWKIPLLSKLCCNMQLNEAIECKLLLKVYKFGHKIMFTADIKREDCNYKLGSLTLLILLIQKLNGAKTNLVNCTAKNYDETENIRYKISPAQLEKNSNASEYLIASLTNTHLIFNFLLRRAVRSSVISNNLLLMKHLCLPQRCCFTFAYIGKTYTV